MRPAVKRISGWRENVELPIVVYERLPRRSFQSSRKVKPQELVDTASLPKFHNPGSDET